MTALEGQIGKAALRDVRRERARQDAQWGGPEHDDSHEPTDWPAFIQHQINRLKEDLERHKDEGEAAVEQFNVRDRLVKIAALALAGITSIDRTAAER